MYIYKSTPTIGKFLRKNYIKGLMGNQSWFVRDPFCYHNICLSMIIEHVFLVVTSYCMSLGTKPREILVPLQRKRVADFDLIFANSAHLQE